MPDPKFFNRSKSFTLQEIADIAGAVIGDDCDAGYVLKDVSSLDSAGPDDLSFLDNVKYRNDFKSTKAGACFVSSAMADAGPKGVKLLICDTPYKAYALAAQSFYPAVIPEENISKASFIDPEAKIGKGCVIEEGAVIKAGASIGDNVWIEPNVVIGAAAVIGNNCRIGASSTVTHALIGDYVIIYPGVRIGQDGFGFAIDPAGHVKVPQLGRVIIGDHVEIGANTTIDRGSGPDTVIGQGTWIDNLVQIGHNARIGKGCVIVAQVGISGSAIIEDYVAIGGQVGIAGHLRVGTGARIGAQSGVIRDVPPGEEQIGSPALPSRQFMRQVATLNRLIKKGISGNE